MNDTDSTVRVPDAIHNAELRAYIIERVNSGEFPDINLHLVSAHCNAAGLQNSHRDALDSHKHEHDGPGTIRNHPREDLFYDADKIATVILECVEGHTLDEQRAEVEEYLTPAEVEVRMEPGDHTHAYEHGQEWIVCPDGNDCDVYPRFYDVSCTRRADGYLLSGFSAKVNNAEDDIARGLLAARGALIFMEIDNEGNGMGRMAKDALAQLTTSIARLYPIIYPEHAENQNNADTTDAPSN